MEKNESQTYILKKIGVEDRYTLDEWKDIYSPYLQALTELPEEPYNDPDAKESWNKWFYDDLSKFLNEREDKLGCDEKWKYRLNKSELGYVIDVIDENDEFFTTLKSDQFGFSRPTPDSNHPYDIYLSKNMDNRENAINQVCEWIYYSRTIGGSFLWPKEIYYKNRSEGGYNPSRGGTILSNESHYIEDRVDITLLEIFLYYYREEYTDYWEKTILYRFVEKNKDISTRWFDRFGSFENYVKFFRFDSFVGKDENNKCVPKSIINGKLLSVNSRSKENGRLMIGEGNAYNNINEEMFERLITWIKDRSWNIENQSDMYEKYFEK